MEVKKTTLIWYLLFLSLFVLFYADLSEKISFLSNPYVVNNDARMQIATFYSAENPELENDYILQYMNYILPVGYKMLYRSTATLIDPVAFGKILSLSLFVISLFLVTVTANRLAGISGAWSVLILTLSAGYFYASTAGGIPRSFAIPLLVAILSSLVFGRVMLLGLVTIIGAAIYPMAGFMSGVTLFGVLFLLPRQARGSGEEWSFKKRIGVVCSVGAISLGLLLPNLTNSDFGRALTKNDCAAIPEIHGRLGSEWQCQPVFKPLWRELINKGRDAVSMTSRGEPWSTTLRNLSSYHFRNKYGDLVRDDLISIALWLVIVVGVAKKIIGGGRSDLSRIVVLFVVACGGYKLAQFMLPHLYFPQRYLLPIIPIFLLLLPVAASGFFDLCRPIFSYKYQEWGHTAFILTLTIFCMLFLGARKHPYYTGYDKNLTEYADYYTNINTLPKDAVIAGWPRGLIESLPIFSQRQAFLWKETHLAFNEQYVLVMRNRTHALIDAYFADSIIPLIRLRDEFGVTHLNVYLPYFKEVEPRYFSPFLKYAQLKKAAGKTKGFEVLRQIVPAAIFEVGEIITLDLGKLSESPG